MAANLSAKLNLDVTGYKQGVDEAKKATEGYKTQLGDLSKKFPSMRKELGQTRRAIMDMESAWRQMSDAQKKSFEGQQLQQQLSTLKQRGADLVDTMGDVSAELRNMASDTKALDVAKQGFDVLGNSVSLVANAYASFTGENEDAKRALTIFATVQSTVNTLTGLQNALQKQSSLMLAITTTQQKLKTTAMEMDTAATGKNIVATKGATAAQAAMNLVADANPYVLLASAIAALVVGYIAFKDEINELIGISSKAETATSKLADAQKDQASEVAKNRIKLVELQDEWGKLTSDTEKQRWLDENKDRFHELGVEVESVLDAENILVNNTDAFIQALDARAKSAAAMALAQEEYEKAIKAQIEAEQEMANPSTWTKTKAFVNMDWSFDYDKALKNERRKAARDAQKDARDAEKRAQSFLNIAKSSAEEENQILKSAGIKQYVKPNTKTSNTSNTSKSGGKSGSNTEKWEFIEMQEVDVKDLVIPSQTKQALQNKIKKLQNELDTKIELYIDGQVNPEYIKKQKEIAELQEKINKPTDEWTKLNEEANKSILASQQSLSDELKRLDEEERARNEAKKEAQQDLLNNSVAMMSTMGQALQNLGNEEAAQAMQFAATSATMIADIAKQLPALLASSIAKGTEAASSVPFPGNIAAIAAIVADIMAIFSALPKFETGGIVGGSSYNGDRVLARVNSGERILTAKQNKSLNSAIAQIDSLATTGGKLYGTVTVKGSDLNIAMKNYNKTINKSR